MSLPHEAPLPDALGILQGGGDVAPTYMWEQWQWCCKLQKLLFLVAARGTGGPLTVLDKVLPCVSHVDNGCIANLVRRGCDLTVAAEAVVGAAAELTVGGEGGGAQQRERGRRHQRMDHRCCCCQN